MVTATPTHNSASNLTNGHSGNDHSKKKIFWLPYFLVAPALVFISMFLLVPILRGAVTSFFDPPGLKPEFGTFVGLDNYTHLLTDARFWNSLSITLIYTIFCLIGAVGIGMITALLLNSKFKGRGLARVLMTAPWAVPEVAAVMIWVFMLDPNYGVINFFLKQLGLIDHYVRFLNQVDTALPTVLFITIWKIFPFSSIVLLTALQSVPNDLYESAQIDGANRWQSFWNVTIPWIRPSLFLLMLLVTIWSLKRFSMIWILTQGGPISMTETLVILIYKTAFKYFEVGYATAIGVFGLLLSVVITLVYFWMQKRFES